MVLTSSAVYVIKIAYGVPIVPLAKFTVEARLPRATITGVGNNDGLVQILV